MKINGPIFHTDVHLLIYNWKQVCHRLSQRGFSFSLHIRYFQSLKLGYPQITSFFFFSFSSKDFFYPLFLSNLKRYGQYEAKSLSKSLNQMELWHVLFEIHFVKVWINAHSLLRKAKVLAKNELSLTKKNQELSQLNFLKTSEIL